MSEFSIDRRNGVLLVKFAGSMTIESLDALDNELKAFVSREGTMPTIIDFTDVLAIEQSSTLADREKIRPLMAGKPRVFVSNRPLLYGMLRVYSAHQDIQGEKVPTIVSSLAQAFHELSLIDPEFEPVAMEAHKTRAAKASTEPIPSS